MATLALFDFMIRGGSLALLALWSWLLIRDHRAQLAARVAVAMNAGHRRAHHRHHAAAIGSSPLDPLFELGSVCVRALFWIFARTWFNDAARVWWSGWLAIAASLVTVALRSSAGQPEDDALVERLRAHMTANLSWRDETLTIAALAAQLGEQEYRLRRAINGALGHRNFAQFLKGYRLAEVKSALADPAQREVPIITIALDAGFGSLGPFNRAFREAVRMTPSEFRARLAG